MSAQPDGQGAVLETSAQRWSPAAFDDAVAQTQALLKQWGTRRLATQLDNGAAFLVLDEAARQLGLVHVPLPLFFTPEQLAHALSQAGVDTWVGAQAPAETAGMTSVRAHAQMLAGEPVVVSCLHSADAARRLPDPTSKITFTSGSTGAPKGVCLSAEAMDQVASSLAAALAPLGLRRHLSALPYAVLLENIAGWRLPRQLGATVVVRPLAQLGLGGAAQFDAARFDAAVRQSAPCSLILLPQMLRAWCAYLQARAQRSPPSLKFVAVGGAAVGAAWIDAAQALGMPVYEGYGLSEGASVQTLNVPGAQRVGSVGRALAHAQIRVASDGELWVRGALFNGYLGEDDRVAQWWPTGDVGRVDEDGFVYITGRKRNVLITAFGRNVSPEWVETTLCAQPAIAQAVVFGEGAATLSAVLWPASALVDRRALAAAVAAANAQLPDYARVGHWMVASVPFDSASGLATPNGRARREAVWQRFADALQPLTLS